MTQCSKQVYPSGLWGGFHGHQCRITKNIVMRDGQPYCRIHDPVREKTKRQERQEKWDEENKKQREARRRLQVMHQACEGVPTGVLEKIKVKDLLNIVDKSILSGRREESDR